MKILILLFLLVSICTFGQEGCPAVKNEKTKEVLKKVIATSPSGIISFTELQRNSKLLDDLETVNIKYTSKKIIKDPSHVFFEFDDLEFHEYISIKFDIKNEGNNFTYSTSIALNAFSTVQFAVAKVVNLHIGEEKIPINNQDQNEIKIIASCLFLGMAPKK